MDNSQFRHLLQKDATSQADSASNGASFKTPTLGSRARNSIPMTPRSVMGRSAAGDFARQVEEHARSTGGEPPAKRFKSRAAPRGTKLAQGYNDRTFTRKDDEEEESDKVKKLRELEAMVKEEKIDRATFDKLRDQMGIGGDLSTTHLVKGLDFKLLDKARKGDDLNEANRVNVGAEDAAGDMDDEFDSVLDREITARKTESPTVPADVDVSAEARTTSRDEILRRLKASRNAGSALVPDAVLGERFKKLAPSEKPGKQKFVETIDGRRREVLVIRKDDGTTKRKTRWLDPEPVQHKPQAPLGMEVPAELAAKQQALAAQEAADEEDEDIFAGVGADYDPLKDVASDDEVEPAVPAPKSDEAREMASRNYFNTDNVEDKAQNSNPIMQDPTLMAALKRAANLRQHEEATSAADSQPEGTEKSKQFLEKLRERERQDAQDMDLGFGDSRYGDDDDDDGPIFEDGDEPDKQKRKRGPRKRKGNKDNVADVMSVLDGRKK